MSEYRVTFPQRFATEPHPRLDGAHPQAWVAVEADSEREAWDIAAARLGRGFSFIFDAPFGPEWGYFHPRGEIARFTREELVA